MYRNGLTLIAALSLSACGLAGTAATGATVAQSEAEAAKQAQQTERQVQQHVEAAQQLGAEQRRRADDAGAN
ncbi:MAG: hypothetical protein KGL25_05010 [Gammaproteobacteria bacterium]|nr:hypothetical protein [Gammaproteobacteria bacterium]